MHNIRAAPVHGPRPQAAFPKLFCWNVHGLKPEKLLLNEIDRMVHTGDIIIFTETWLQCDEEIPEILQNDFNCFALHRQKCAGSGRTAGGILVCANPTIPLLCMGYMRWKGLYGSDLQHVVAVTHTYIWQLAISHLLILHTGKGIESL